jgi:Zn-finger nucleic acid-binding protein
MIFKGAKHCSFCGAATERAPAPADRALPCPRCGRTLGRVAIGSAAFDECGPCGGLWLAPSAFEAICAERESQAAVLGAALPALAPREPATVDAPPERYWPCPECRRLMNRFNFAQSSGVLLDVCRDHGIWFDAGELRRIVEFIREGGLDRKREREKEGRARRAPEGPPAAPLFPDSLMTAPALRPLDLWDVLSAARGLLRALRK